MQFVSIAKLEACSCVCVHYLSACICVNVSSCTSSCAFNVFVFEQMQIQKKCMCGHCYVIQSTSCILERHCGLQGERADPLHHHYHYHHQSSFKWCSWTQQCIKPLVWPHLDITFERGKMEQEKELKERDGVA